MKVSSLMVSKKLIKKISGLFILLIWLILWTVIAGQIKKFYLPSPFETAKVLFHLLGQAQTYLIVLLSLLRVLIGLFLALLLGLITGIFSGRFPLVEYFFHPLIVTIKSTPVISFILLALLYLKSPLIPSFCGMLLCYPIIYTNIVEAYKNVSPDLISLSKLYKVSKRRQLLMLYLPSMSPYIIAGTLTSIGVAWKGTIAAEVLSILKHSIGYEIYNAKIYVEIPLVFAWTILIVLCSFILQTLTKKLIEKTAILQNK